MRSKKLRGKIPFCTAVFIFSCTVVFSQDASFFTTVLDSQRITWEQAAFLAMAGSGRVPDTVSPNKAWESLSKTQWYTNIPEKHSPISVQQFSYLLAMSFNVNGGLWFTLFNNERYAYREMVFKSVVPGSFDPHSYIKGPDAMKILEKAIAFFSAENQTEAE